MAKPKAGPHFTMYSDFMTRTARLNDTEFRQLVQTMCSYVAGVPIDEPALTDRVSFMWETFKIVLDRQLANQRSDVENGHKGGRPPKSTEPNETQSNPIEPNETQSNPTSTSTNTSTNTYPTTTTSTASRDRHVTITTVEHAARTILHASTATVEVLKGYAEKFREGEAIVLHAMNEAAASGDAVANPRAYTIEILRRYEREGVQTLVEAAASDHKGRTSAQATGGTAPRAQDYQQRPYTGDVINPFEDPEADQT